MYNDNIIFCIKYLFNFPVKTCVLRKTSITTLNNNLNLQN